jgi:squalene synthase HpnC
MRNTRNTSSKLQSAFDYCEKIAKSHYENFPIGWFVPKAARRYLYAIYAFARTADDYSDERSYEGQRLERLDECEKNLEQAVLGRSEEPLFTAVAETLDKTGIPIKLLKDLLAAFRMDVHKSRYLNYRELEKYCTYSANPIGRIVLMLFGFHNQRLLRLSDKICTGIQLVNHWQDVGVDLQKDRVYLPAEDLKKFHYSYEDLTAQKRNDAFRALMRFQISRTRSLFEEGKPLLDEIGRSDRRLKWQVSLMWWGPMRILEKIEAIDYDVFNARPTLTKGELMKIFLSRSLRKSR